MTNLEMRCFEINLQLNVGTDSEMRYSRSRVISINAGWRIENEYHVIEAEDGMEGISEVLMSEEKIDLIITDLKMPVMDGIEFAENLPTKIPFIIISGFLYDAAYIDLLEILDPVAVFKKPFQLSELQGAIASSLQSLEGALR